ncbi:MAG: peptidase, M23/M37 family [Parcubacteria bacterium C7867-005]|nr:MAG: peptidase, M23/M37 family [Parcubacteria bacterium C7867-005]
MMLFLVPQFVVAETADSLRQKIEEANIQKQKLQEEQIKLQKGLDILNNQGKTLQGTVKSLDATRKKLETDIKVTKSKINGAELNIKSLENSMTEKERDIDTHQKAISMSIQKLASYDSKSMIADLLTYKKISEVWHDRSALGDLQDGLGEEIAFLRATKNALEIERDKKEKTKKELQNFNTELGGQKKVVEVTQANQTALLIQTKNKEAEYQKMLSENIANQKKFESDLFNFESQLKLVLDPNLIPEASPAVLAWPLEKIRVTQMFGATVDAKRLYTSQSHSGVDFAASVGSAVLSVKDGVVTGSGNTDLSKSCKSYGRWLLVRHDNGLSSFYSHLSNSLVTVGQKVSTGQIIGYSGGAIGGNGSGYSTGPHLHFGLYVTQAVSVELYSNSINCKNVYIPISKAGPAGYLDPLAYLPAL